MWQPNSIFTKSSFLRLKESSAKGDTWPHNSLSDKQHGKAIPLSSFLDFLLLKTLVNSSTIKSSTCPQTSVALAPSTQSEIANSRAAIQK